MKSFKNWKIATKIMSISVVTIALVVAGMLLYFMPLMGKKLMDEKNSALKNVVDVALSMAASYESQAKTGILKTEDAKKPFLQISGVCVLSRKMIFCLKKVFVMDEIMRENTAQNEQAAIKMMSFARKYDECGYCPTYA